MRQLRYVLELTDGSHRDESFLTYTEAEALLSGMDWKSLQSDQESGMAPVCPFMLFLDPEESFFMIMPEVEGLMITAQVTDKWNLLGMLEKHKSFTLNFGVLTLEDSLRLLKLFYEDKYPTLRALEKAMSSHGPMGAFP